MVSGYTEEDGLYVANYYSEQTETSLDAGGYQPAGSRHTAVIPSYPIYINGQRIDNSREAYPLLNFRGITYFPLTWRFVVDEFGWDETWSDETGYFLCTWGRAAQYPSGTHYYGVSFYALETYRDYAILEKMSEERVIEGESDNYVGRKETYYKLNYAGDTLTEIASKETADTPHASGAVSGESVDALFSSSGSVLYYQGNELLDLTEDAGAGNAIAGVYGMRHSVNGMSVYTLSALFTQGETAAPPPYTSRKYYAFADSGDGVLHRVASWPTDQVLSAVYPRGADGVYLCSTGRIFGSSRWNNSRGWITAVGADLSETALNGRWADWNSLRAVGMDDAGNLYLLNTWFPDYDTAMWNKGEVSPVNDGYFRLGVDGSLTKVHPFVDSDEIFVTPSGGIYIHLRQINALAHLQTGARITPD